MKNIFHISDVHIDIERYDNLMNSFNKLVSDIMANGVSDSLLVIVGDIFENKTILTSNDINIFDKMMSSLDKNKITTLIVVGNHDFNINYLQQNIKNESDQQKLALEILTKSYDNITCLTYTQVYLSNKTIKNKKVEFHVYSIVDNLIPEYFLLPK